MIDEIETTIFEKSVSHIPTFPLFVLKAKKYGIVENDYYNYCCALSLTLSDR